MAKTTNTNRRRPVRGQTTVEFAMILVLFLALVYGIMEIGRLLLVNSELENAAREASHYAALHPTVSASYLKTNVAGPKLSLIDKDSPDFVIDAPTFPRGGIGPFYPVEVRVHYTWTSLVNIMPDVSALTLRPLGPLQLSASSTKLIEGR